MATGRPKRSISKPNYRELSDVQLPKERKQQANVQRKDLGNDRTIYRLNVLEEDESRGLVKISYIGYGSEWDEWRRREDLIELNEEDVDDEDDAMDSCAMQQSLQMSPLNLYEQLATNIKLQLVSYRKRNPYCRISMNFNSIYFEGLIQRGSVISRTKHLKKQVYTVTNFSKFNDILGKRWYIRGLNSSGDFCYVKLSTVEFYLKHLSGKTDYQFSSDGTLCKNKFGAGYCLVFSFVREDGTLHQWNAILEQCK